MTPCSVDDCDRRAEKRGWCNRHYQMWRRNGAPVCVRDYGSKRNVSTQGYVRIWEPDHPLAHADGYVMEHHKVLYDLGVRWPKGWIIHHSNEDKTDNRPENLSLVMNTSHSAQHVHERGKVENQFGMWPLRSAS